MNLKSAAVARTLIENAAILLSPRVGIWGTFRLVTGFVTGFVVLKSAAGFDLTGFNLKAKSSRFAGHATGA